MKKYLSFFLLLSFILSLKGQNEEVETRLKEKFSLVQYRPDCGGWYFLQKQRDGQTYYGIADLTGNILQSEGLNFKLHNGFIELYLLDANKKMGHDRYLLDMKDYEKAVQNYNRINDEYDKLMTKYEADVENAKIEARNRYNKAVKAAEDRAEAENRYNNAQNQPTTIAGALLQGLSNAVNTVSATSGIKLETYVNQVLGERGLVSPPSKPYNPKPVKPVEPPTGFYWQSYPFKSPNMYTSIKYQDIMEDGGFADVEINGKYGLIDSYFNEIVPCTNNERVKQKEFTSNRLLVKAGGKYGVIDSKGEFVIPIAYSSIDYNGKIFKVCKSSKYGLISYYGKEVIPCQFDEMKASNGYQICKMNSKWGIYTDNYEELYPCLYQELDIRNMKGGMALYNKLNGLWGIVDFNTGKQLVPNEFCSISIYNLSKDREAFLVTKQDSSKGIYSTRGYILLPCEFEEISQRTIHDKNYFTVKKDNTWGIYDVRGIPVIPVKQYNGISWMTDNSTLNYVVTKGDLLGLCNQYGVEIVPCIYKQLIRVKSHPAYLAQKVVGGQTYLGVISERNTEIVPFTVAENLEAFNLSEPYVLIKRINSDKKTWGAIDYNGRAIVATNNESKNAIKKADNYAEKYTSSIQKAKEEKMKLLRADQEILKNEEQQILNIRESFSFYAKNYVERLINEWQKRSEFESTTEWQARVNPESREQKIFSYTREAQDSYIAYYSQRLPADEIAIIGNYDPDNHTYRLKSKYSSNELLVEVDREDAQEFKMSFQSLRRIPQFFVENDKLGLAEYVFYMPNGHCYKYSNQKSLTYSIPEVNYNFAAVSIDPSTSNMNFQGGKQTISTSTLTYGTSDVDVNIPTTMEQQNNTFVVIIANENYQNDPKVEFAYNDGQAVKEYCLRSLGIPRENIVFEPNATLGKMRILINWLRNVSATRDEDSRYIIYYIGHGVPSDDLKDVSLLPVDGDGTDYASGYKRSDLFQTIGEFKGEVLVFLDACFSGVQRSGDALASTRGVARTPSVLMPSGNSVVFSASSGSETAHPYKAKSHGMFTYFFLKTLQQNPATLTLGDLVDNVTREVSRTCIVVNGKSQTPNLTHALNKSDWRDIVFKR